MRTDEVKRLVSMLYDMELNNYMMNRCIEKISDTMSGLKYKKTIPKPAYVATHFQKKKSKASALSVCATLGVLAGILLVF